MTNDTPAAAERHATHGPFKRADRSFCEKELDEMQADLETD